MTAFLQGIVNETWQFGTKGANIDTVHTIHMLAIMDKILIKLCM